MAFFLEIRLFVITILWCNNDKFEDNIIEVIIRAYGNRMGKVKLSKKTKSILLGNLEPRKTNKGIKAIHFIVGIRINEWR